MRLLRRSKTGEFSLTENLVGDEAIPPYAILSHTWGADTEEVTFDDLTNGTGKDKPGYEKIRFCGEQARQDHLQYFWIDTCCINKINEAELSHAINSMFRWYRNATRCYVYLSDVSTTPITSNRKKTLRKYMRFLSKSAKTVGVSNEKYNPLLWESDFRKSKWFTRGWTLQELLAPVSVEFFSQEWKRLGDKGSLKEQIYEITGIPDSALQGALLSQFGVNERFSWIERRQTKLEEDKAYSLLGIFDVHIPLMYGEGMKSAFKRLREEIDKLEKCIQDLRLTDPRDDMKRIEDSKGGLLEDSYHWILENSDFRQWRSAQQSPLLWVKGDPGKGKTMLLCGIANELNKSMAKTDLLSYFFCQATDSQFNNATAVLRGLMYLLVDQQPSLISHIRKKHDHAGKALFEDANAWVALSEIFTNILQDPRLNSSYLIIDALDECVADLPRLLDFIAQKSSISSRVKWVVSSRNWHDIEERLEWAGHKMRLCLELNAESVSTAVNIFIQHRVLQLAQRKKYNDKTRDAVLDYLCLNANDTFLWVALVCQNLEKIPRWNTLAKLNAFPPGLDSLYKRMMQQICNSDNADLCKRILASIVIVYRPITLRELTSLIEMLEDIGDDLESLQGIISLCGSFLTIREGTIYFVHQSAKDYLLKNASNEIFPSGNLGDIKYDFGYTDQGSKYLNFTFPDGTVNTTQSTWDRMIPRSFLWTNTTTKSANGIPVGGITYFAFESNMGQTMTNTQPSEGNNLATTFDNGTWITRMKCTPKFAWQISSCIFNEGMKNCSKTDPSTVPPLDKVGLDALEGYLTATMWSLTRGLDIPVTRALLSMTGSPTASQLDNLYGIIAQAIVSVTTAGYFGTTTVGTVGEPARLVYITRMLPLGAIVALLSLVTVLSTAHIIVSQLQHLPVRRMTFLSIAAAVQSSWWDREMGGEGKIDEDVLTRKHDAKVMFGVLTGNPNRIGLGPEVHGPYVSEQSML